MSCQRRPPSDPSTESPAMTYSRARTYKTMTNAQPGNDVTQSTNDMKSCKNEPIKTASCKPSNA